MSAQNTSQKPSATKAKPRGRCFSLLQGLSFKPVPTVWSRTGPQLPREQHPRHVSRAWDVTACWDIFQPPPICKPRHSVKRINLSLELSTPALAKPSSKFG